MLAGVVAEAARRHGDRVAWAMADDPSRRVTFGELPDIVERLAGGLHAHGVREGDVVALVLRPGLAFPLLFLAAARLGAATAGVNERLTAPERATLLQRVGPRLVVGGAGLVDPGDATAVVDEADPARLLEVLGDGDGGRVPDVADDPERPVAVCFTSGTTGSPKGAVFAGRQLEAVTSIDTGWTWGAGGAGILATSFAHLGPMTKLAGAMVRGTSTFVLPRWSPRAYLDLVARERVPVVAGVPTQLAMLLTEQAAAPRDLSGVGLLVVGGGPATPELLRRAGEVFSAPVAVRYSCTEAGIGLGTDPSDPVEVATTTVGRPRPGVEVAVRVAGRDAAVGEVGDVLLRSPAAMSGYLDDPAATAAAFTSDGWVRTGDLGWLGEDGRLRLAGRSGDGWVRGGHNVHPLEIEAVLAGHPGVREVAVVGVDDDVYGQVGAAFVVPSDGVAVTLQGLRDFARGELAHHKLPERLTLLGSLPLTPGTKVDRAALRARA